MYPVEVKHRHPTCFSQKNVSGSDSFLGYSFNSQYTICLIPLVCAMVIVQQLSRCWLLSQPKSAREESYGIKTSLPMTDRLYEQAMSPCCYTLSQGWTSLLLHKTLPILIDTVCTLCCMI